MKRGYKTYVRKKIDFEDDLVIVYDENETQIYKGIEDYEPMKDENWTWDAIEQIYRCNGYIKICLEV
jgi:peptidoglycan hydrolase-like amidase